MTSLWRQNWSVVSHIFDDSPLSILCSTSHQSAFYLLRFDLDTIWAWYNINFVDLLFRYIYDVIMVAKLTWKFFSRILWHTPYVAQYYVKNQSASYYGFRCLEEPSKFWRLASRFIYDVKTDLFISHTYLMTHPNLLGVYSKFNKPSISFLPLMVWSGHDLGTIQH